VKRRAFISLLGGAAAWPFAARAQQGEQVRRVGVLMSDAESDPEAQANAAAARQGLQELGWTDGRNVRIDYRWAGGDKDRMRALATELVALQPDVILARSTPATAALKAETRTIPIVFTTVSDPIGSGFVASVARPGGNITGFTNFESSMGGKWLGLLKEIAPRVTRTGMMFNPETAPYAQYYMRPFEAAARSFAVEPVLAPVHDDSDIVAMIESLTREPNAGLIVLPDAFTTSTHRKQIFEQASRRQLPTIYPYRFMAAEGGLMSYGIDITDLYGAQRRISIASCVVRAPPISRSRRRSNSSSSSTSRPPRRSGSRCLCLSKFALTGRSNDPSARGHHPGSRCGKCWWTVAWNSFWQTRHR
jgi:putative tryptophan/tyrosine transport system substrate-binding protein